MRSKPTVALAFCWALFAVFFPGRAHAQAMPDIPPPSRYQVDENGVDLARGTMTGVRTDLSIGAEGRAGLSLLRRFGYVQGGHNYDYGLFLSGGIVQASAGLESIPFTVSGSTYTAADGSGATLVKSGTTYTLTLADGTVIVYNYGTKDHLDFNRFSRATSITYASGEKITLTWVTVSWCSNLLDGCSGGTYLTGVRLQAAASSMGYQLHFNYGRADVNTPGQATGWRRLDSVTAINTTVESCSPSAHLCSLTNPWPTVAYSGDNVTDPAGRTSTFTQGTLTYTIRRPSAGSANATFTLTPAYGRYPVTQVVRDGLTWTYAYSVTGTMATMVVTLPGSPTRTRTVVSDLNVGLPTSVTNEVGQTTTYAYDASGRLTRSTAPEGNYVENSYDARGNVTQTQSVPKSGSGAPTLTVSASFPASCSNPRTCNQPTSRTDALGNVTDYTYDSTHGGVLTVTAPAPTGGAVRPQLRHTYSALTQPGGGTVYRITQVSECQTGSSCAGTADEYRTTIAYSQANLQPSSVTNASGNGALSTTSTMGYDIYARKITVDGPLGGTDDTTRTRYNLANEVIGTITPDPDGAGALKHRAQRFTYNSDAQVSRVETGTVDSQSDADWAAFAALETEDLSYDTSARLARRTFKGTDGVVHAVIDIGYDGAGRRECVAQRMNSSAWGTVTAACTPQTAGSLGPDRIERTTYDAADRPTLVQTGYTVSGEQADEVATAYTNNGRISHVTDANGNRTTYEYDGLDRLVKTRMPSPTTPGTSSATDYEQLTLDANGNVTSRRLRDGNSIATTYDALNRVAARDMPGSEPDVTYSYDLLGRVTGASQPGNALSFSYDALSRNLSQTGPRGTASYQYDLAGRRTQMTYADSGLYIDYDYFVTGEVSKIRENGATSGIGVLATYSYDNLGRRTAIARGNGTSTGYSYYPGRGLESMTHDFAGTTNDVGFGYDSNPAGQIFSNVRNNDAYSWTGHYGVNRNYTANGLNQYTAAGSITPTYDNRGNLTSAGTTTYGYNADNMLVTASGGVSVSYDPLQRMYETVAGATTRMAYDGDSLIAEYNSSNALARRYVYGPGTDEPLVWYEGSGTSDRRWLHADERGSVVAVSNASGAATNINTYDEYGIPGAGNAGRFQYTGQQWIGELGMYHYKARIYSPTLGRFLQTDPIGYEGGMNLHAYVSNDPVNRVDPTGLYQFCYTHINRGWVDGGDTEFTVRATTSRQVCYEIGDDSGGGDIGGGEGGGPAPAPDACGDRLTARPTATGRLATPTPGSGQGAPGFGNRPGGHYGTDFANPVGGPVYAAGAGRVTRADGGDARGFGNQIVINHGGGVFTQYGHLGTMSVRVGASVNAGQTIGTTARPGGAGSGNLGSRMSPHVHFEVRLGSALAHSRGGNPINPQRCLP